MLLYCVLTIFLESYILYRIFVQYRILQIERAERDIAGVSASLKWFKSDVGRYPETNESLFILYSQSNLDLEGWQGPYISRKKDISDPWEQKYRYLSPGIHNQNLFSHGIDGIEGTNDDINNWNPNKPWRKLYQTSDFFLNNFSYRDNQFILLLLFVIIFFFCLKEIIFIILKKR